MESEGDAEEGGQTVKERGKEREGEGRRGKEREGEGSEAGTGEAKGAMDNITTPRTTQARGPQPKQESRGQQGQPEAEGEGQGEGGEGVKEEGKT